MQAGPAARANGRQDLLGRSLIAHDPVAQPLEQYQAQTAILHFFVVQHEGQILIGGHGRRASHRQASPSQQGFHPGHIGVG